ncbi:MAG: hypothetical protein HY001_01080 [Candidatus Portnoybacteria bacterium]|nr:hypothetical protein [Candidatus Portnoybacteria bacterium]
MAFDDVFSQGFAKVLDKVCQELTPELLGEEELSPLREIEHFLWDWEDIHPEDGDLKFLGFFFRAFLMKVFDNFTAEIPPVVSVEHIFQRFIDDLKETFVGITACLREARYADLYPYYKKIGIAFLNAVDALNRTL